MIENIQFASSLHQYPDEIVYRVTGRLPNGKKLMVIGHGSADRDDEFRKQLEAATLRHFNAFAANVERQYERLKRVRGISMHVKRKMG